jgi:multiple sugar transport system substrate-binding protein
MPTDAIRPAQWSRRRFISASLRAGAAVGAAGGLSSFLAACSSADDGQDEAPPADTPIEGKIAVTFMPPRQGEQAYIDFWNRMTTEFPKLSIDARPIPSSLGWTGYIDAVNTQIAGGQAPDVCQVATEGLRAIATKARPIEELISRDQEKVDALMSTVSPNWQNWLKQVSPDGKQYYLPGDSFNTMGIWYNKDIFDEAGISDPGPDWTWDDFASIAQRVAIPGNRYAYNVDINGGTFQIMSPWLLTNGASILNKEWSSATLDQPAAIEAVEFLKGLADKRLIPTPGGKFDQYAAASQGKLAMLGGGRWPAASLREEFSRWRILPWPQNTTKGSPVGWRSYAIINPDNVAAAWELVKFSGSQEASEYFNVKTLSSGVPTHSSLFKAFADGGPEGTIHLCEALEYATVQPSPVQGPEMERQIADSVVQMLLGNTGVADGMRALNRRVQDLL